MEKVAVNVARQYVQQGRQPYQYVTKDPHVLPIFGPAYDVHGSRNVALRDGRLAESIEEAQKVAKRLKTEVTEVYFLVDSN